MKRKQAGVGTAVRPRRHGGRLLLALVLVAAGVVLVIWVLTRGTPPLGVTVCLDAGHGGYDAGCTVDGLKESEQNLSLALTVQEEMEQRGITVILTRSDDTYVSLEERAEFANSAGADYFISLHRNSADADASGIEIWYSKSASDATKALASAAETALVEAGVSNDRGCHSGSQSDPNEDYAVCRLTQMPAILIEMGFMTSSEDNELFLSNQRSYAEALADAVVTCWEASESEREQQ